MPRWPILGWKGWNEAETQPGNSGRLCCHLVLHVLTQNRPSGQFFLVKRIFLGNILAPFGPNLEYSGSCQWTKLVFLDVLSAVSNLFLTSQKKLCYCGLLSQFFKSCLGSFCLLLQLFEPLGNYFHNFNLDKRPHLVCLDPPCCIPSLLDPFQPKIGPLG